MIGRAAVTALSGALTASLLAACGGGQTDRSMPATTQHAAVVRVVPGGSSLADALRTAPAGARVVLAPGRYAPITLGARAGGIRIVSESPLAAVVPRVAIDGADDVALEGLRLEGDGTEPTLSVVGGARGASVTGSSITATRADAIAIGPGVSRLTLAGNRIATAPDGTGISFDSTSTAGGGNAAEQAPISDVVIRRNRIARVGVDGIRLANFRHVLIDGNDLTGVVEDGRHNDAIQATFGGEDLTIRGNRIHGNTGQGIFIKDGRVTRVTVENNLIVDNRRRRRGDPPAGAPMQFFDTARLRILNNTVWGNDGAVLLRPGVSDVVIRNNLLESLLTFGEDGPDPAAFAGRIDQDYNLVAGGWSRGAVGEHDIDAAADAALRPRFRAPGGGDWTLAADSPGVDAGTSAEVPRRDMRCGARVDDPAVPDTGGGARPYVDLGALEAGAPAAHGSATCSS